MNLFSKLRDLLFGKNGYDAEELEQKVQLKKDTTKRNWDQTRMAMEETKQAWQFRAPKPEDHCTTK